MKKIWLQLLALFAMFMGSSAFAAATDFASAIPTSLLPTGFWSLSALVLGVVATIGGVLLGIKLMRRARG